MGFFVVGGEQRDEYPVTLRDGRTLKIVTYDTGAVRIYLHGGALYVLSEVSLKGDRTDNVMIELSPGGQGSAAYSNKV
ncbi:hypothetical protein ABZ912_46380 [Nonomuraea angiospora]|uniref:hypothetical protein n=1 Tax=Nonomuraea angiospora TaxID=46172 RepID=UPI0033F14D9B